MNGVAHPINDQRERTILAVQSTKFLNCNINAAEKETGVLKCAPTICLMSGSIHENIISHNWDLTTTLRYKAPVYTHNIIDPFSHGLWVLSSSPQIILKTDLSLPSPKFRFFNRRAPPQPYLASIVIKTTLAVRLAASK